MRPPRDVLLIPAWNEARNLPRVLEAAAREVPELERVVVDDGSHDETARAAEKHGARVLSHPFNLGYGASLQTGYKYAYRRGARFLVQMDGDGQHDPSEIPALLEPLRRGELDLAVGSRFLGASDYSFGLARGAGRRLFGAIARGFGLHITDPTSGFQALNRKVLALYVRDFFPSDFPDVDVLLAAHRCGLRIGERSVHMAESSRSSTLHGGLRPVYYVYKMLLSIMATPNRPPPERGARSERGRC